MNTQYKAALATAALAMALAACSGQSDNATSPAPQAPSTPSAQSVAAQPAPTQAAATQPAAAQGAVLRDYPSESEEKALKLNYGMFQSYGKDSARITPFFPGSSQRPVTVKLEANGAGYRLTREGSECKFPISYTVVAADGKTLATGTYAGGTSNLAGWPADQGAAVFTLKMADGAANNYGCNVVITKE